MTLARLRSTVLTLAAAAVIPLAGCDEDESPTGPSGNGATRSRHTWPPSWPGPTGHRSPAGDDGHEAGDADVYAALVHEGYTFQPSEDGGPVSPLRLGVHGSPAVFIFEPVTSGVTTLYRIVYQQDLYTREVPAARSSGVETSWSELKSLWN